MMIDKKLGDYQILEKIDEGGMGVVYKALEVPLDRLVALKMLPPQLSEEDESFIKRFKAEAQAAAKLNNPHIVQIYSIGEQDGYQYFAMEYVEGANLTEILRKRGSLPLHDALSIAKKVASALSVAHKAGITHRDIKPENILIDKDGEVKVTDFGLAVGKDVSRITKPGSMIGTPAYMSPEQIRGEAIDHRSDIYSLGIVLYETLTKVNPFEADSAAAIMHKHLNEEPESPNSHNSEIPVSVCNVVLKMIAKQPNHRYANAQELIDDIERSERGEEVADPIYMKETVIANFTPETRVENGNLPAPVEKKKRKTPAEMQREIIEAEVVRVRRQYHRRAAIILLTLAMIAALFVLRNTVTIPVIMKVAAWLGYNGSLKITTTPGGAGVFIDGNQIRAATATGETGAIVIEGLTIGKHRIKVEKDGYEEVKEIAESVEAGETVDVPLITLVRSKGRLAIRSEPDGATVVLRNLSSGESKEFDDKTPIDPKELDVGEYELEITKEGYDTCKKTVTIERDKATIEHASLTPQPAKITITSEPPGATVKLNGEVIGKTAIEGYTVPPPFKKQYEITLQLDGYAERRIGPITLSPGQEFNKENIELAKPTGTLIVITEVQATVQVDKDPYKMPENLDPLKITVLAGQHTVTISAEGYDIYTETVEILPGREETVKPNLEIQKGYLDVETTPEGMSVYVNGELKGKTPLNIPLPVGEYEVEIKGEDYLTHKQPVHIERDTPTTLNPPMQETGWIFVRSDPGGAKVYLDGKYRGDTDADTGTLTLENVAIGERSIAVVKEGYQYWSKREAVQRAKQTTVDATLTRKRLTLTGWPMLGRDAARTGYHKTRVLLPLNPVWKYPAQGKIMSSPIIVDGIVYAGDDKGLFAVDAATGREVWRYQTEGKVVSSPAFKDGTIFFGGTDKNFYALKADTGKIIWQKSIGAPIRTSPAVGTIQDVVNTSLVYFGAGNTVYALDIDDDGEVKWQSDLGSAVRCSPALGGGSLYIANEDGDLFVLSAADGGQSSKFNVGSRIGSSPVAINGGTNERSIVYVNAYDNRQVCALVPEKYEEQYDMRQSWAFPTKYNVLATSPAIMRDKIIIGITDGTVYAVYRSSEERAGQIAWEWESPDKRPISSPCVATDDTIFVGTSDGVLHIIDAKGESKDKNEVSDNAIISIAVVEKMVFVVCSDGTLHALESAPFEFDGEPFPIEMPR